LQLLLPFNEPEAGANMESHFGFVKRRNVKNNGRDAARCRSPPAPERRWRAKPLSRGFLRLILRAVIARPRRDKWFELRAPIATMGFIKLIAHDMKDNHSPLADIGYYLQNVDGCVITAQAIEYALGRLPVRDRWCVEFGAGDDLHGSTTNRLIAHRKPALLGGAD
jgi:hypothetical protein